MSFKDMTDQELLDAQGEAIEQGDLQYAQDIEDYSNREN